MFRRAVAALRPVPLRDWTLRARLISSMLGLIVLICVGIGVFTTYSLHSFLVGKLDDQLSSAGQRANNDDGGRLGDRHGFPGPGNGQPPAQPNAQSEGSIEVFVNGSVATGSIRLASGVDSYLGSAAISQLADTPTDGEIRTVDVTGHGSYRIVAGSPPGSNTTIVTGLPLAPVNSTVVRLSLIISALSLIGLLIAAALGALIVRLALRPLNRVTATASRVAEMSLDEGEVALAERVPVPNPRTEVGQVGVALNRMLQNVDDALNARHRSELRVRQFVADASHELRTPLASIRGYAELTRRSREAAPPDIAHAMGRVESEAGRMTALVEDLLLLARLDAGRPLEAAEVDLTRLAVDALGDAHAAGPEHHWQLELPDEPVTVIGDAARLHQVLANLLANARSHTPAGTSVTLSLFNQGETASIVVRDNGPGIPSTLMPDIFQRFSRGEQSRSRTAGSTGLGLAIVAAVVAAHHGRITVTSQPGVTEFTVQLPLHGNPELHGDRQASSQTSASQPRQALPL
jgi:two-component system OmpR family sensor kinase